jgi:predicted membrane protein
MVVTKKRAEAISTGVLLIFLGILFYLNAWWPGILLAIWAFLGTRQFLTERYFDFALSTTLLVGSFLLTLFNIDWKILGPILFILGGLYIIFREYFYGSNDKGKSV